MLALAGVVLAGLPGGRVTPAVGLKGAGELLAQTDDSAPAKAITLFGASAAEEEGEVWGLAQRAGTAALVHYSTAHGWSFGAALQDAGGEPLSHFELDTPEAFRHSQPSPIAATTTRSGAGAMLGNVGTGASLRQAVLVRDPGGAFKEAPVPEGAEGLLEGEKLFGANLPPLVAALDESGHAGAFVVPTGKSGVDAAVLHWNGSAWAREPIEEPAGGSESLEVLAISAASPENAWLLARVSPADGGMALFRRRPGASPSWQPVTVKPGGQPGEQIQVLGETIEEPSQDQAQLLTATSAGVWVDGRLRVSRASATLFVSPEGEAASGSVSSFWCRVPASSSEVTETVADECANHNLPEAMPTDFSRSFAWAGAGSGERIVTGLKDGQMMRFVSGAVSMVNSLGALPETGAGARFGAAFTGPQDGWLGKEVMPVHITTSAHLQSSRLQPWPVPFRYALTALAPQPGAQVGGESSEVLAVGDRGEVARYKPGSGWFPETLPGPGGKRQTPRLRATAWPTPSRAFAVGDSEKGAGQMWLWRGETGLWEKDPAMPLNFRGNLLGIAFDPADPSRGYAVGQQGVLLSYGKSWTQEPEEALPAAARGANFTGIAFAGSEAIVVWRKLVTPGSDRYTGGVIVNSGSGWHEDEGADAVLGTAAVPWAVAALADGGAAFTAQTPAEGAFIFEREAAGAPWQRVTYPGGFAPGSLAVFREGGSLRAIGTGAEPATFTAEEESAPPPGFPPILVDPYPLVSDPDRGVLRQTAGGWSDEEHDLNDAREPPGGYVFWDTPAVPDPANAILVDPTGSQGWAVGGYVNNQHALLDTADIYRYPSEAGGHPGDKRENETTSTGYTAIAAGGGAGCAAPCATRSDTGIGPAVWLKHAIEEASELEVGGRKAIGSFLYTGPGVTTGQLAGPPLIAVPWAAEESYYAERTNIESPRVCTAPAPTDREGTGQGGASVYEDAFSVGHRPNRCGELKEEGASYAFMDGEVRVIVIDTSLVHAGQRELLAGELSFLDEQLKAAGGRAVVAGNADLPQEYAEGKPAARELVSVIEADDAAAYIFDKPEQNVSETLTGAPAGKSTPAYGSGTLGYVNVQDEEFGGFIGQSGFLVIEVSNTPPAKPGERYASRVKLVPNVEELAIEAQQGTLLRRSQVASFAGLARRPRAGNRAHNQATDIETAPYIAIPSNCQNCAGGIEPEYRFSSSNREYGEFVRRNIHSAEVNAVEHDAHGKPISEEAEGGKAGLFCAFNKTPENEPVTVSLKVGNLSYSLPVTIQGGSVRQPCGTTKLKKKPSTTSVAPPPPPGAPETAGEPPASASPLVPPAPAPVASPVVPPHTVVQQFIPQPAPVAFLPAFVPVPLPTPARPTPPSGTSPVTSPVEAAQKEDEEEAAPESVDAAASAYHPSEHETPPVYLLGLVVLAAFAGASLRGRRGPGRGVRVAPATVTATRAQRRYEDRDERRRW